MRARASGIRGLWLVGVSMLAASMSAAQDRTCRDITFPQRLQLGGAELTLNGLGARKATFLKVNVYVAALYVASPSHDPKQLIESGGVQELTLRFVRNVGVDDLRKAFVEGFARSTAGQSAALQERIRRLNGWMTAMKTGQNSTFVRLPGAGVRVSVNGLEKGTIEGGDFSRAFISIWLGATPPNPELKEGLLGGACG
jgi:Chalcone isomerase-like